MKRKALNKLLSYFLVAAMLASSSPVTALADTVSDVDNTEPAQTITEEILVPDLQPEVQEPEIDIPLEGTDIDIPSEEIVTPVEDEELSDEETDVADSVESENMEAIDEVVLDETISSYDFSHFSGTGTIEVTTSDGIKQTYSNSTLGNGFQIASDNVGSTVILKSNIIIKTATPLWFNSNNTTLDIGQYNIQYDSNLSTISSVILVYGDFVLKGTTGKIVQPQGTGLYIGGNVSAKMYGGNIDAKEGVVLYSPNSSDTSFELIGGTIKAQTKGISESGSSASALYSSVVINGGTINVNASTTDAVGIYNIKNLTFNSGTLSVKGAGNSYGISSSCAGTDVCLSRESKLTIEGKNCYGVKLDGNDSKVKSTKFDMVLKSTVSNGEIYGITAPIANDIYGGNITINAPAATTNNIFGIYSSNSVNIDGTNIKITATAADYACGIYSSKSIEVLNSTISVSGKIKYASGISTPKNATVYGNTITISTQQDSAVFSACGVEVLSEDTSENEFSADGNNITVNVSKAKDTYFSSLGGIICGIYVSKPYEFHCTGNTVTMSASCPAYVVSAIGVEVPSGYIPNDSSLHFYDNICTVSATSDVQEAYGYYVSTPAYGDYSLDLNNNTIQTSGYNVCSIMAEGGCDVIMNSDYVKNTAKDDQGPICVEARSVDANNSAIYVQGTHTTAMMSRGEITLNNCYINVCGDYGIESPFDSSLIENTTIIVTSNDPEAEAYGINSEGLTIKDSSVTVSGGAASYAVIVDLDSSHPLLLDYTKLTAGTADIAYLGSTDITINAGCEFKSGTSNGILYSWDDEEAVTDNPYTLNDNASIFDNGTICVDENGSSIKEGDILKKKYFKVVNSENSSLSLDFPKSLSKDNAVKAKLEYNSAYTLQDSTYEWKIDGKEITAVTSDTLPGLAVYNFIKSWNTREDEHTLTCTATAKFARSGNSPIERTMTIEQKFVFHPSVTLHAYDVTNDITGSFSDNEPTLTYYDGSSSLSAPETPEYTNYLFVCWTNDEGYVVNSTDDSFGWSITDLYAYYVPNGLYIQQSGNRLTTFKNGSVVLSDETYTGSQITPDFDVYFGYTHLSSGIDYTVSYVVNKKASNINVGTATITITGKGKYSGSIKATFSIKPSAIAAPSSSTSESNPIKHAYTGSTINCDSELFDEKDTYQNRPLKKGTDYTLAYYKKIDASNWTPVKSIKDKGLYKVVYTGKGNYKDDSAVPVSTYHLVTDELKPITASCVTVNSKEYTGSSYTPGLDSFASDLRVTVAGNVLSTGTSSSSDYIVLYRAKGEASFSASFKPKEIGTYEVMVVGTKNANGYDGTVIKSFQITGTIISKWKPTFTSDSFKSLQYYPGQTYNDMFGYVTFTDASGVNKSLTKDTDYTITYGNASASQEVPAGKVKVTITGKGAYTGSITKTYTVKKFDIAKGYSLKTDDTALGKVSLGISAWTLTYWKGHNTQDDISLSIGNGSCLYTYEDITATSNNDKFKVSYKNNDKVGTATGTITGIGNFTGSIKFNFNIVPCGISNSSYYYTFTAEDRVSSTKAGDYKTTVSIYDYGMKLTAGTDYDKNLIYKDSNGRILNSSSKIKSGDVITVIAKGKGNYTGIISTTFTVRKRKLSSATVKVPTKYYTGEEVMLTTKELNISMKGYGNLVYGEDYKVLGYTNNTDVGTASVIIQGIGEFAGTRVITFKIQKRFLLFSII